MGLFSSSKKEKLVAIFDIGSGSIGGALVRIPFANGQPVIIKSVRTEIPTRSELDFSILLKDMVTSLGTTANSLYGKKVGAPEEIVCVLSSPWYLSETRTIKISKEKSFVFTKRLADELIQKEISSLGELYKEKYGSQLSSLPKMIEQYTMSVSLNGYPIIDPIGKKCKFFDMNMVLSLSPQMCLDKIHETLAKTFHHIPVTFSSFTLDTYLAVRDKYITEESYLLLDIRGEITDVGIITKGVLKSVLSFPFGKKTFFKYMCTKLEIELRDAEELFRLYSGGNLSEEFKKKVIPLFESIEKSWGEAYNECINTLPHTLILPSTIFLTTDNDIKKWFADALSNNKYVQSKSADHKCTVVMLEGSDFLNMCDVDAGTCDPFLMIESIAIMRKRNK